MLTVVCLFYSYKDDGDHQTPVAKRAKAKDSDLPLLLFILLTFDLLRARINGA